MVRGTEKRVIRVKCDSKSKIEEAFLIMKPGWEAEPYDSIVNEAEKLIYSFESSTKKKKRLKPLLPVFIVLFAAAALAYFVFK